MTLLLLLGAGAGSGPSTIAEPGVVQADAFARGVAAPRGVGGGLSRAGAFCVGVGVAIHASTGLAVADSSGRASSGRVVESVGVARGGATMRGVGAGLAASKGIAVAHAFSISYGAAIAPRAGVAHAGAYARSTAGLVSTGQGIAHAGAFARGAVPTTILVAARGIARGAASSPAGGMSFGASKGLATANAKAKSFARRTGPVVSPIASGLCAPAGIGGNPIASLSCKPLRGGKPIAANCTPIRTMSAPSIINDALIPPSIEFIDGFDLGIMQSIGGSTDAGQTVPLFGRWGVRGSFVWHESGGRDNGGWLEVTGGATGINAPRGAELSILKFHPLFGSLQDPSDDPGAHPVYYPWAGFFLGLDQRGVVPNGSTGLLGAGLLNSPDGNSLHGYPRFVVRPDYGIDFIGTDFAPGGVTTDYLLQSTGPGIVPVSGFYGVEMQLALNPTGVNKGGFGLLRVYRLGDTLSGLEVVHQVGVRTGSITTHLDADPTSATLFTEIPLYLQPGIGIDDFIYYEPTGTSRRWLLDSYIEGCPPVADVSAESLVAVTQVASSGTPAKSYGGTYTFGDSDRTKQVSVANSESRPSDDPAADTQAEIGTVSGNTGAWVTGPTLPPPADPIKSNKVIDAAKDVFSVSPQRTRGTVEVIGLAIRGGHVLKTVAAGLIVFTGDEFGFGGPMYNMHGPEFDADPEHNPPGIDDPTTNWRTMVRPLLQSGSSEVSPYPFVARDNTDFAGWQSIKAFWPPLSHIIKVDPATGSGWQLAAALVHRLGYVGDTTVDVPDFLQTPPSPPVHRVAADIIGLASEIVYHPIPVTQPTAPLTNPICDAALIPFGGGALVDASGTVSIFQNSVDFNDGPSHVLDHVTVVVNFGDGSSPQTFAGPGQANAISHTMQRAGILTITVTATNAHALTCTQTFMVTVANRAPTAGFTFAEDGGDITGFTADFTSTATDPDGDSLTYVYDFDVVGAPGVHTSTSANPSFNFTSLGAGVYVVKQTVDDGHGHTASFQTNVTVPIGAAPSFAFDEEFPDADTAAFIARVAANTDYRTDLSTVPTTSDVAIDNSVQFRGHASLKVLTGSGGKVAGLYRTVPHMMTYWNAFAIRVPANFMTGHLSDASIATSGQSDFFLQEYSLSDDGGSLLQWILTTLNTHGAGGAPSEFATFEANSQEGAGFDEFVYDDDGNATSGRTPTAKLNPFTTAFANDTWIIFASYTQNTSTSVRRRTWYSTDDGATWTLLLDQKVLAGAMNGETWLNLGIMEMIIQATSTFNGTDDVHWGMWQLADATLPGNADPYGISPGP